MKSLGGRSSRSRAHPLVNGRQVVEHAVRPCRLLDSDAERLVRRGRVGTQNVGTPSRVVWRTAAGPSSCGDSPIDARAGIGTSHCRSYLVRRPQHGRVLALSLACRSRMRRQRQGARTPCGPIDPAQRPLLRAHGFCSSRRPSMNASGRGGHPGTYTSTGKKFVDALHHAVDVVHAARIRARSHRDDPAWLHHLLVEAA